MKNKFDTFLQGVRGTSPFLLGIIPFGVITGAVSTASGMPEWGGGVMTAFVFAGASQLAAIQLMVHHAPLWVVILTALIVNARMLMYSASLAPHFNGRGPVKKAFIAYLLTDQAYLSALTRYSDKPETDPVPYYLGGALLMWVSFNAGTWIGGYAGALIPPAWQLDFAVHLTFIALVIPVVKDRPALAAALVASIVAVAADGLPFNLGLLVGAVAGIATGYTLEKRRLARA